MTLNILTVDVRYEHDVVLARQKARTIASALKFDVQDQTRIATAVSEIVRNVFQYAGSGRVEFCIDESPQKSLVITIKDKGKGIPNLDTILGGKYVSETGMGVGMIGAKRLMDHFHVETGPDEGTTVVLEKNLPLRFTRFQPQDLTQLLGNIEQASNNPYEELQQQNKELLRAMDELRNKQMELAQLNRELDETNRGVVALYAELNDKADFLQRASEMKSNFLSNMSHEFRTPLNSVLALSQILLDKLDGPLSGEQEKQVRFIRQSAQDLTDLVNDLLDIAKVEAGKVTIRPVRFTVESVFAALRGMLRPLVAQNSSISLTFEDPSDMPEMFTDEAKLSQILRNFVSNALKFTERGEIRVSVSRGHDDAVVFSVSDTGIGIAPENQERIFKEWEQIEGKLQKTAKGTGLGLPLSRKLAQLLGGNIYVKSKVGEGSTFFVSIPTKFAGATEVAFVPEVSHDLDSNKLPILVVEDNREALFLYEKYLKNTQFQLIPAKNLNEARKLMMEFRPLAVILDVLLEGEHSWDLLQELKQNPSTRSIPVYVVTVVDNKEKAFALGADGFHPKPLDRLWLLQQLQQVANRDTRAHVLVIDDDEVARYLLKGLLAQTGFRIAEAKGGNEGLRHARQYKPDLIILDLGMPDLSGFEVILNLKEDLETAKIPVIIHTSKILSSGERSLLEDAVDIISKNTQSREIAMASFLQAFAKAGISVPTEKGAEVHI
jgi:signal transduction histidine kinase/CheY-like chemotaxis protein